MKILGISRAKKFSPNSVQRDAAIFYAVVEQLRDGRHDVDTIGEDEGEISASDYDCVFSMGRSEALLKQLKQIEDSGVPVVNSPTALLSNNRTHQAEIFSKAQIPIPKTIFDDGTGPHLSFPFWLKSSKSAQMQNDVCFIPNEETYRQRIEVIRANNSNEPILQVKHEEGDLVKFYGVADTSFFYCIYPMENGKFSKFGLETHNSPIKKYNFSKLALRNAANKAANITNLTVYGGDAIVHEDGTFSIIDFNDWPSFAPCRKQAAPLIANKIITTK